MAHTISDRWLWLGVGIAFYMAVKGIKYAISDVVNITQLPPDKQESDEEETKFPEDSRPIILCYILLLINVFSSNLPHNPRHTQHIPQPANLHRRPWNSHQTLRGPPQCNRNPRSGSQLPKTNSPPTRAASSPIPGRMGRGADAGAADGAGCAVAVGGAVQSEVEF